MKSKDKAVSLTIGILTIVLIASFIFILVVEFFLSNFLNSFFSKELGYLSVLIGATVLFIGSTQTLRFYATYLGDFSGHGVAAILNATGIISVSIGYAVFIGGDSLSVGLILGQMIGQFLSLLAFLFYTDIIQATTFKVLKTSFVTIFEQAQKIPILLITQIALVLSSRIPTLVISIVGGISNAGAFAMAERVVSMPTGTFGQAIGQAARYRFNKVYKIDNQDISLPRKIILSTFFIGFIGYGLLIALADWFVPLLLGEQWQVAIPFVQIIAIMELFNFVFYSVEDIAIIRNNFSYRMWSQITQLVALLVLYVVVDMTNILLSVEWALGLICLSRILFVVYDLIKIWHGVKK
jgi:O-antigen/teichoic acid export membrane protein